MTGRRATRPVAQRDADWLAAASPDEVSRAHRAGELVELFGGPARFEPVEGQQWTAADLDGATADQIGQALARGDLADLLVGREPEPSAPAAPPAAEPALSVIDRLYESDPLSANALWSYEERRRGGNGASDDGDAAA
ncbi:hypothetical protein [Pseudofrankia inefficax]|uniref:Uncharacterized protein n=1 Tax=Pseudofrankia inefficax (strain DSM 45817 / CECT 9037 / DDB 130130 / EuI1c) TaxID=298654 RepID=E3J655_PSEI1|nr:hypothetical protein [Pseudofrankia inefficax]ADP78346.1 hypothetical protein FraEuI1c_0260 [Pseudofrankia inefficax]